MGNHSIKTILEATVYDKYGNIKSEFSTEHKPKIGDEIIINKYNGDNEKIDIVKMPFKSWNMNFIPWMITVAYGQHLATNTEMSTYVALNDLTPSNWSYEIANFSFNAGDDTRGIWVGTGSGAMTSISESNLKYKISDGIGTGQLLYSQTWTYPIYVNDVGGYSMQYKRMFTNNSGATITIGETGIFSIIHYQPSVTNLSFTAMFARDATEYDGNPLSLVLADTQVAEINYYFSIDSGSFLNKNFMSILNSATSGTLSLTKYPVPALITITSTSLATSNYIGDIAASEGVSSYGVVVGTGTDAINMEHYSMSAQIIHGTGSGQLYHYAGEIYGSVVNYSDNTVWGAAQRNFSNYSDSAITVNEVALYGYGGNSDTTRLMWGRALTGGVGVTLQVSESAQFRFIFSSSLG